MRFVQSRETRQHKPQSTYKMLYFFRFFDQMLVTVERAQKSQYVVWCWEGSLFLSAICCKTQYVVFFLFLRGCNMGLTSLEVVKVYSGCPVPYIQEKLEESGYKVKLSMVADMLQIVYLEEELEWEKIEEELRKSVDGRLSGVSGGFLPA